MVKRFDVFGDQFNISEDSDGDYVEFDDHVTAMDSAIKEADHFRESFNNAVEALKTISELSDCRSDEASTVASMALAHFK
jgi:hypothetical protein